MYIIFNILNDQGFGESQEQIGYFIKFIYFKTLDVQHIHNFTLVYLARGFKYMNIYIYYNIHYY